MTAGDTHTNAAAGGHETRDVSVRPIVLAGVGLLVVLLATSAGAWWLLAHYQAREARESPPASPLAGEYGRTEPPVPRLQTDPLADLRALRAEEDARLTSYGWVDRDNDLVHIPIERAVDLLAERAAAARSGRTR
jgi:hypothetical protein